MPATTLYMLVRGALPQGFSPEELLSAAPAHLLNSDVDRACEIALREHPSLDWEAYSHFYPDVCMAGADIVEHFIQHGIYEGRKLFICGSGERSEAVNQPDISIIVPCYNGEAFLKKAIESACSQTYANIEIILVDDGSTDNSKAIMEQMAKQDPRIRILALDINHGVHMARKAGAAAASGRYTVFMDCDDLLSPDACKCALSEIQKGYDFICFRMNVSSNGYMNPWEMKKINTDVNRGVPREFRGKEILAAVVVSKTLSDRITGKIYRTSICKDAFAEMVDGFLTSSEDLYETIAILGRCASGTILDNALYTYNWGYGISTQMSTAESAKNHATICDLAPAIKSCLDSVHYSDLFETVKKFLVAKSLSIFVENLSPSEVTAFFDKMAYRYGIGSILEVLVNDYFKRWEDVAAKFRHYESGVSNKEIRRIGIHYMILGHGGAEKVIKGMVTLLLRRGFEITLFLARPHEDDFLLDSRVKTVYLGDYKYDKPMVCASLLALRKAITDHPIDLMFMEAASWDEALLWQIILLKYSRIPVILHLHSSFYRRLLHPTSNYTLQIVSKIYKCAEKVICLSSYGEIYYHALGIDASYIPNFLPEVMGDVTPFKERKKKIIVFCRLGAPEKNVYDCIRVLGEIRKVEPFVQMIFIGDFVNKDVEAEFYKLALELEVNDNITVTGWLSDARFLLGEAIALLSTSYHEAFPLAIGEAQAAGLPVVMYELPIMQAVDNKSIIQVPHGEYKAAAEAILWLMNDEESWEQLSETAMRNAAKFDEKNFEDRLLELIQTFRKQSPIAQYSDEMYREVLRTLAFYGAHMPPWVKN